MCRICLRAARHDFPDALAEQASPAYVNNIRPAVSAVLELDLPIESYKVLHLAERFPLISD